MGYRLEVAGSRYIVYRNCESIKSPIQQAKAAIHIRKIAFAKIARDSKISSQPSQPPKAHIHIENESEK